MKDRLVILKKKFWLVSLELTGSARSIVGLLARFLEIDMRGVFVFFFAMRRDAVILFKRDSHR